MNFVPLFKIPIVTTQRIIDADYKETGVFNPSKDWEEINKYLPKQPALDAEVASGLKPSHASTEGIWSKYPFWLRVILCPLIMEEEQKQLLNRIKIYDWDEQRAKLAIIKRESVK